MKGFKKWITVAIIMLTVFSLVVARGATDSGKKQEEASKTIRVLGAFTGDEAARFEEIVRAFNAKTGYNVVYEASREFEVQIQVLAEAGTPPDIAALPQPGLMKNFASRGYIKPLSSNVVSKIDANYADVWKDLGSYNGQVYGLFHRVSAKSFVWYPKKAFEARGYTIPKTWAELIALQDKIAASGVSPWAIGFESGGATGWVGTDWVEDIMLRTAGPDVYDKWVNHEIPFNHPSVQEAFKYMGEIMLNPKNVYGGATNILTTPFGDSVLPLFDNPPKAFLHRQANFIIESLPESVRNNLEQELGVFALPAIDPKWGTPVVGGGDQFVVFKDSPIAQEFLAYLTEWEACASWAKSGGALFPHKNQNFNDYGNSIERDLAKILVNAEVFRFDGSDLMPAEVGAGSFWTGIVDYISGKNLNQVLDSIEKSWPAN
ncbi:MAG: ABC transporter substrate-binding protein [Spirochaetota bacterium]|jgi:alpha-glucoside transport system substrate-binding protein|nr:ABC transporter substrate-binding protein [Spirochaetota bacterium]